MLNLAWDRHKEKKLSKEKKFNIFNVYKTCLAEMYAHKDQPDNILQQKCWNALGGLHKLHGVVPLVVIHWATWMCENHEKLIPLQMGTAADAFCCEDSYTRIYSALKGLRRQASI